MGKKDLVIKKTRYSGFYETELDAVLKGNLIDKVEVVGVCTSICVMDTVGVEKEGLQGESLPEWGGRL